MSANGSWGRKDMGDLKKNIEDTADTSKKIVQGKFNDVKKGARNAANAANQNIKSVGRKSKNVTSDIKIGSSKIWKAIKKTASNITRTFTS